MSLPSSKVVSGGGSKAAPSKHLGTIDLDKLDLTPEERARMRNFGKTNNPATKSISNLSKENVGTFKLDTTGRAFSSEELDKFNEFASRRVDQIKNRLARPGKSLFLGQ